MEHIANGPSPNLKNRQKWSKYFCDFIKKCTQKIPDERPDADELLKHTFITRVGPTGKDIFADFIKEWDHDQSYL